jgi:ABC-2 type transport system permease protein
MQPYFTQLSDLFLMQLTNWRWSWPAVLILGIASPIFLILLLSLFTPPDDTEALSYILTGNMVLALLLDGLSKTSNHFVYMRTNGQLEYFATLPIHRSALILATVLAFLLLSLPSVVSTLLLGGLLLNVEFAISPLIVLVIPLIVLSLAGLGALIGLIGRTPDQVGSMSLLATLLLFGFGPVLVPASRLPDFMDVLSLLSPSTYAASALRHVVLGTSEAIPLWLDIAVLAIFSGACLWGVTRLLDWRANV